MIEAALARYCLDLAHSRHPADEVKFRDCAGWLASFCARPPQEPPRTPRCQALTRVAEPCLELAAAAPDEAAQSPNPAAATPAVTPAEPPTQAPAALPAEVPAGRPGVTIDGLVSAALGVGDPFRARDLADRTGRPMRQIAIRLCAMADAGLVTRVGTGLYRLTAAGRSRAADGRKGPEAAAVLPAADDDTGGQEDQDDGAATEAETRRIAAHAISRAAVRPEPPAPTSDRSLVAGLTGNQRLVLVAVRDILRDGGTASLGNVVGRTGLGATSAQTALVCLGEKGLLAAEGCPRNYTLTAAGIARLAALGATP
ncbi:MAG: hypothetical protein GC168_20520 [Candidatus Hydrogenedens sp.]|nr:hypothetical protein [Candidatus Hydrogenedens sp.]